METLDGEEDEVVACRPRKRKRASSIATAATSSTRAVPLRPPPAMVVSGRLELAWIRLKPVFWWWKGCFGEIESID